MSVESIVRPAAVTPVWRAPWTLLVTVAAIGALTSWPFWDGLHQLYVWWIGSPEDGFGVLIPPVALFLIWQQKDRLERVPFTGSRWGLAIIVLGGLCLMLGQLGTIYTLVQYAFVITVYGLVLSLLGWPAFRFVAIPLLILFFMIPLPNFFVANLSTMLQLISSQLGVYVMRLFDISVFLEGNVIDLGGYKLQVADACSGLRYLFPLMTMGFLIAYFYKGAFWKRILLFLSSIPITVLMNSFRIGVIGVTVEHWGIGMAEGFLHEFQGWVVFMVSAGLLILEMVTLNSLGRTHAPWRQAFGVELPAPTPKDAVVRPRKLPPAFLAATALLLSFVAATLVVPRPVETVPARASFAEFPLRFGEWRGHRQSLEGIYTDALKLDDYVLADYAGPSGDTVNVYIAWYNSQRKGEAVHSPRSCLPAGGWQTREFGQRNLTGVAIGSTPLHVNRALMQMGTQRELVYYWFQQRGRVVTNEFMVKWYLFWDALTRHRTDGALIRLMVPLSPTTDVAAADTELKNLITLIGPTLAQYVPD
jgi:exosortase D (VPLPA-CTERM-specific)